MEAYEVIRVIAEGTYGVVLQCLHRATDRMVAIKKLKHPDALHDPSTLREIQLLRSLSAQHDHIVNLLDVFRYKQRVCLVFEYVQASLLEILCPPDDDDGASVPGLPAGPLDSETIGRYIYQLVSAVQYLHSLSILHRDIKPENILISSHGVLKLCDFGWARRVSFPEEPEELPRDEGRVDGFSLEPTASTTSVQDAGRVPVGSSGESSLEPPKVACAQTELDRVLHAEEDDWEEDNSGDLRRTPENELSDSWKSHFEPLSWDERREDDIQNPRRSPRGVQSVLLEEDLKAFASANSPSTKVTPPRRRSDIRPIRGKPPRAPNPKLAIPIPIPIPIPGVPVRTPRRRRRRRPLRRPFLRPTKTPPTTNGPLTEYVSTRWYRAPELLVGDGYGKAVDVWGIGCGNPYHRGTSDLDQLHGLVRCFGRLSARQREVFGKNPKFEGCAPLPIYEIHQLKGLRKMLAGFASKDAVDFIEMCLVIDPDRRKTVDELLLHPFLEQAARWAVSGDLQRNLEKDSLGREVSRQLIRIIKKGVDMKSPRRVLDPVKGKGSPDQRRRRQRLRRTRIGRHGHSHGHRRSTVNLDEMSVKPVLVAGEEVFRRGSRRRFDAHVPSTKYRLGGGGGSHPSKKSRLPRLFNSPSKYSSPAVSEGISFPGLMQREKMQMRSKRERRKKVPGPRTISKGRRRKFVHSDPVPNPRSVITVTDVDDPIPHPHPHPHPQAEGSNSNAAYWFVAGARPPPEHLMEEGSPRNVDFFLRSPDFQSTTTEEKLLYERLTRGKKSVGLKKKKKKKSREHTRPGVLHTL